MLLLCAAVAIMFYVIDKRFYAIINIIFVLIGYIAIEYKGSLLIHFWITVNLP